MKNEFLPYDRALKLKELGFDEPCIATHGYLELYINTDDGHLKAPLYQQAFRWFREEYKFHAEIRSYTAKYFTIIIQELKDIVRYLEYGGIDLKFNTYEEAELACLDKLIELVESKQNK
jgi:hypothetical protein